MIIRYHSKTPGTPLRQWDIVRKSFEVFDSAGNKWRVSDLDHPTRQGLHISAVETANGIAIGVNVLPVTGNAVDMEMRQS
jgi:hypothetical protein